MSEKRFLDFMAEDVHIMIASDTIATIESIGDDLKIFRKGCDEQLYRFVSGVSWVEYPDITYPDIVNESWATKDNSN